MLNKDAVRTISEVELTRPIIQKENIMTSENDYEFKFENPELQEVYENSKSIVEEHKKNLDRITRDIHQLETFLKKNVFVPFEMDLEFKGEFFKLIFKEGRLMFEDEIDYKPLLETKVTKRLRCDQYLKLFLMP
mgnify:CR=1 FL=1